MKKAIILISALAVVLLLFFAAVSAVDKAADEAGQERLENAIRQAAVACYSVEGIYPPDIAYLQEHYGLQIDDRYIVHYKVFADNLMPDITVLERDK